MTLSRDEKIAEARRLSAEGWNNPQIARQLGTYKEMVWRWLNPEKVREVNRKRAAAKRAWENDEAQRSRCGCGALLSAGSRYREFQRCADCYHRDELARTAERGHRIEAWWAEGLSLNEIAARLGWTRSHMGVEMDRLRRKGFNLPYRNRGYSKYATAA